MGSKGLMFSSTATLPFKTKNKEKRQSLHVKQKRARDSLKRDERFRRKRAEDKDPSLREQRQKQNVPATLDRKRVWDDMGKDDGDGLGLSVDVEKSKRLKTEEAPDALESEARDRTGDDEEESSSDADSMLDSGSENEEDEQDNEGSKVQQKPSKARSPSPAPSTGTNLDLTPEALAAKFPTLFSSEPPRTPKILITTSINSTLHREAQLLTTLFPHSVYIRRSAHRYGHKFSLREIASFATNRNYTTVVVLLEDQKRPTGLTIIHLEHGPTFHFSINNWVEGKKLPGHGNPTDHYPELILNNFRTPLGLLTAHLFKTLFPPQPELQGRQVVTLHNQRDYIFVRRHRYVFREKRATEKSVIGPDGKEVQGVEGIRTGLQELGPRFTLKLRRVDKQIGRGSLKGDGEVEWQWKGRMEKQRTKFQL
jgi:ribosome production factor 1